MKRYETAGEKRTESAQDRHPGYRAFESWFDCTGSNQGSPRGIENDDDVLSAPGFFPIGLRLMFCFFRLCYTPGNEKEKFDSIGTGKRARAATIAAGSQRAA
jgi:hypothetical protein